MRRTQVAGALGQSGRRRLSLKFRRQVCQRSKQEEGVILVFWAVSLAALVGFLALVLNIGNLLQSSDNVQNAADSAAISGATATSGAMTFSEIGMDSTFWPKGYAKGYDVEVSNDGNTWTDVAACSGTTSKEIVSFPVQTASYIRVVLTATAGTSWSIGEFTIYYSSSASAPSGGNCSATLAGTQLNESTLAASTNAPSNAPPGPHSPQNAITNVINGTGATGANSPHFSTDEPQAPGLYFEVASSIFATTVPIPAQAQCDRSLTRCRGGGDPYGWLDGYYIYGSQPAGPGWLLIVSAPRFATLPPGEVRDRTAFRDGAKNGPWFCSLASRLGTNCDAANTNVVGTTDNALSNGAAVQATNAAETLVAGYEINANWTRCAAPPAGFYLAEGWGGVTCIAYCVAAPAVSCGGSDSATFLVMALVPAPPSLIRGDGVSCTDRSSWASPTGLAPGAPAPSGTCT
jgi:hypothetical protein